MALFLAVVPALAVIVGFSQLMSRLALAVGQPRVVGEMVAGLLLGPSLFGLIAPELHQALFSPDVKAVLYVLGNIGLTTYMFLVGAEIDRDWLVGGQIQRAVILAVSGIVPSFLLGVAVGYWLHGALALEHISALKFAFFMGCASSITAFPMLARILQERGLSNSLIGSLTLVAASIDDAVAWSFLAIITAMFQARTLFAGLATILGGIMFTAMMLVVVRPMVRPLGDATERSGTLSQPGLAFVLLILLGAAWFTDYIGIFSVFGGFITGLCMPRTQILRRELRDRLLDFNVVLLIPVFFTYSGLNTRFNGLTGIALLVPFLIVLLAAVVGKYGGCGLTMRMMGFSWRQSSAIGGLMNARGLMELMLINLGLAYGMITQDVFSILMLMTIITTAMAMPIYRLSLPREHETELRQVIETSKVSQA
ncbi:MAG TPA: cation:proton antiporter [Herpetosiphonaceae bacterium]